MNNTTNQRNLRDIYSTTIEHRLFSTAPGTFSQVEHLLGHKKVIDKQAVVCTYNGILFGLGKEYSSDTRWTLKIC